MGNLDRIRRLSRTLRLCIALGITSFVVLPPVLWAEPSWLRALTPLGEHMPETLVAWQQWTGGVIATVSGLVGAWMLSALWRLFGLYGQGRIFEAENVRAFRQFGLGLIAYALTSVVTATVLVLVLTATAPVGHRILEIGIDDGDIATLILGGVFFLIARVMDEGRHLQEDQAAII